VLGEQAAMYQELEAYSNEWKKCGGLCKSEAGTIIALTVALDSVSDETVIVNFRDIGI
jgi:hypothetical protein